MDLAPEMTVQARPLLLQSFHPYAYLVGLPVHEPFEVDRVLPCCGVPLMTGGAVFEGGVPAGATVLATFDAQAAPGVTIRQDRQTDRNAGHNERRMGKPS
jgi:hypothetical protein